MNFDDHRDSEEIPLNLVFDSGALTDKEINAIKKYSKKRKWKTVADSSETEQYILEKLRKVLSSKIEGKDRSFYDTLNLREIIDSIREWWGESYIDHLELFDNLTNLDVKNEEDRIYLQAVIGKIKDAPVLKWNEEDRKYYTKIIWDYKHNSDS